MSETLKENLFKVQLFSDRASYQRKGNMLAGEEDGTLLNVAQRSYRRQRGVLVEIVFFDCARAFF